eukprot:TRINITY_DN18044_c0_g1_i8.p1 TRINITY_DN18044_c0_g1~~TRINITY_DN18044_c0_g1_i8.p1  ORF type:complete len:594 (-),score=75.16 TRINITY_DN18044_c0_g1_i8:196-1977(-)
MLIFNGCPISPQMLIFALVLARHCHRSIVSMMSASWDFSNCWITSLWNADPGQTPEQAQFLERALHQTRVSHLNIFLSISRWATLAVLVVLAVATSALASPSWMSLFTYQLMLHLLLWYIFTERDWSAGAVKAVLRFMHFSMLLRNYLNADAQRWFMNSGLRTTEYLLLSTIQLDWRESFVTFSVHCFNNVLKSRSLFQQHELMADIPMGSILYGEVVTSILAWFIGFVLETWTLERLKAMMEAQCSSHESTAAHRLLSVFSDATIQLGPDLCIRGPHERFCQMMMINAGKSQEGGLKGVAFSHYLSEADQSRFTAFIDTASKDSCGPASSLHVRMRDSCGLSFQAELFHAPLRSLDGMPGHIIGVCEEGSGPRQGADRTSAVKTSSPGDEEGNCGPLAKSERMSLPLPEFRSSEVRSSLVSMGSASSSSSARSSSQGNYPELENISIILDAFEKNFTVQRCTFAFDPNANVQRLPKLLDFFVDLAQRKEIDNMIRRRVNEFSAGIVSSQQDLMADVQLYMPGNVKYSLVAAKAKLEVSSGGEDDSSEEGSHEMDGAKSSASSDNLEVCLWLEDFSQKRKRPLQKCLGTISEQ